MAANAPLRRLGGRGSAAAGLLLLSVWALPLFAPPGPVPLRTPATDAALLVRLFPGVPPAWVGVRLLCLALGAALVARSAPRPPHVRLPWLATWAHAPGADVRPAFAWAALAVASAHALSAFFAAGLSRAGQLGYLLALAVPPALLVAGRRREGPAQGEPWIRPPALVAGGVLGGLWVAHRLALAWHGARTADVLDLWHSVGWLEQAVASPVNLLLATGQPGVSSTYMLLLGASFLGPDGFAPSLGWVQLAHAAWLLAMAVAFSALAGALLGRSLAWVGTAVFLWSPFVLLLPYSVSPFGIFVTLGLVLLLLLGAFAARGSVAALAGLGAVAGLGTTTAYLYPWVGAAGLAAGFVLLRRRPRPAPVFWAIGLLGFFAAAAPALPGPEELREMTARYAERQGQWATLEAMLYGQRSPFEPVVVEGVETPVWSSGRRGPLDVPLGSLLAPFAVPRTGLRLWSDALFEPVGGALAAVGLALCLAGVRRSAGARGLLALLALALLPATVSSAYDRASLTRNLLLPVPVALLAGVGFEAVRNTWLAGRGRAPAVALVVVAVAAGGTAIFDRVAPSVLPASAVGLAVEAVEPAPPAGGAVLLDYGRPTPLDWLHVARIGRHLPEHPLPARLYTGPRSLYTSAGHLAGEVLLWSPALEHDEEISRVLCERWRATVLYELVDRAGLSRALAARPEGASGEGAWSPALPPSRWRAVDCGGQPVAEGPASRGRAAALHLGSAVRASGAPSPAPWP